MAQKVHVLIPYTTEVACGAKTHYETATCRESVTCRLCKKTDHYKNLKPLARKFRGKQ